jgi:general secretion pathway protein B
MSYILEALKKAQAERQLGEAPSIHAGQVVQVAPARGAGNRKPLLIGVAAGVLVAGVAASLLWRHQAPVQVAAVAAPAAGSAVVQAPANNAAPAADAMPAAGDPVAAAAHAGATTTNPVPAATPRPSAAKPLAAAVPSRPAAAVQADPVPAPRAAPAAPVVEDTAPMPAPSRHARKPRASEGREPAAPALARQDAAAASPGAPGLAPGGQPPAAAEEYVRTAAELPEPIRRELPKVAFGGYMYSPNPADRLVLVDKTLRHEGEEVAPGLVLEKLLPKSAVLVYRGYRYRVAL